MQRTQTDHKELKSKGNADGSARYETGVFPLYDKEYQKQCEGSVILNDQKRGQDIRNSAVLLGLSECRASLAELIGGEDEDGNRKDFYQRNKTKYKPLLTSAKESLGHVHQDFAQYQKQQLKKGNALQPPKNWPDELLEARLKAESKLDMRRAEKAKVEAKIHKLTKSERRRQATVNRLFRGGMKGNGSDSQKLSYTDKNIAFIDDERSAFDQMPLYYYKQMIADWKESNDVSNEDHRLFDYRFKKAVEDAFNEGQELSYEEFTESVKNEDWFIKRPTWPEGVPTISELELENDEED